jgi:FtsP/CotA-like multicopper oxidase with cupredoxin domain
VFAFCPPNYAAAQVIVVNGKPSPTVRATVGDRIIIKVINKLNEPLSIHW